MKYKLKEGFVLKNIGGENIVITSADTLNLNVMISLNDTGAFIWNNLSEWISKDDIVKLLLDEYDVEENYAQKCVKSFIDELLDKGYLETN